MKGCYLSNHGEIEDIMKAKLTNGTARGDYIFNMRLDRRGFMAIPHTLDYESQVMTVVVEGRNPNAGTVNNWGISQNPALKRPPKQ